MCSRLVLLGILLAGSSSLLADGPSSLKDRLRTAAAMSSLNTPEMKPWHLAMNFEILDPGGRPTQTGTVDELWSSATLHKTIYTFGQSTWTEIVNQDGIFISSGVQRPPELVKLLRSELVHPFPSQATIDEGVLTLEQKQIGGVALDCVKISGAPDRQDKPVPDAMYPTYCLDRDKVSLRITTKHNIENLLRISIGTYAGKNVAIDQAINFGGTTAAKSHLIKLQSELPTSADFTPDPMLSKVGDAPLQVAAPSMAAKWIKKVPPVYPEFAKRKRISGTVLLHAVLGKDGHLKSLEPIYSPDPVLTDAAVSAVRQWVYEPYLVAGIPSEVDTEIVVNFSFLVR